MGSRAFATWFLGRPSRSFLSRLVSPACAFIAISARHSALACFRDRAVDSRCDPSPPYGGQVLRGTDILIAILATRILPPVVIVLPIYLIVQKIGALDTRFALIATYTAVNLPVAVWLSQPVLGEVATDLEEAAQLDGASRFRIFFKIVVPVAARGLFATGLLIFVLCWNEYFFPSTCGQSRHDHAAVPCRPNVGTRMPTDS